MAQELGRMPDWMIQSLGGKESVLPQLEEADQAQLKAKAKMPAGLADALGGQERIDSAITGFDNQSITLFTEIVCLNMASTTSHTVLILAGNVVKFTMIFELGLTILITFLFIAKKILT
jgi:hypothetical protein